MKVNVDPSEPASVVLAIVLVVLIGMGIPYVCIWSLNRLGCDIEWNFWNSIAIWSLLVLTNSLRVGSSDK
jgi:hypothetical protein